MAATSTDVKVEPSAPPAALSRVAVGALGVLSLGVIATLLSPEIEDAVGPPLVALGTLTAGVLFVRGRRALPKDEAAAWFHVGLGFVLAGLGIVTVGLVEVLSGQAPAFGATDVFFILSYIVIIGGLAAMPHVRGSAVQRLRVWLDGLIGAVSLGVVLWVAVLSDIVGEALTEGAPWQAIVGAAYAVTDVVGLIVIMIVTVRRSSLRFDARLMYLGIGLASQAIGDVGVLANGLGVSLAEADPDYTFYVLAAVCYAAAAALVARRPAEREYAHRSASLLPMIAPYTAAVVLIGLLVMRVAYSNIDVLTIELLFATLLVGFLVIGRQAVAIRENRQLVERERAALVSSISHELRTPLTAMMGFLELLTEEGAVEDEGERAELTEVVHSQAVYMSRIVSDLIMLARGNPSDVDLSEGAVRVRDAIDAAIAAVPAAEGGTDVSCAADLVVRADGDRLQQVLVNFLSNAVRYGGDYRAVVATAVRDDVIIEVHDNGSGVPPRYALMIWERFERGPNRYNAVHPGSGIGLAVVDAVARAHGGSATYERSGLLGGACFRVVLPARRILYPPVSAPEGRIQDEIVA